MEKRSWVNDMRLSHLNIDDEINKRIRNNFGMVAYFLFLTGYMGVLMFFGLQFILVWGGLSGVPSIFCASIFSVYGSIWLWEMVRGWIVGRAERDVFDRLKVLEMENKKG